MATQSVSGDVPAGSSVFTPSADEERNWFAIFTRSHHEKRVAQYYIERQIEHFLPLYRAVHQWTNYRRVNLELPLFPNYVFVRICRRERVRALEVPGALYFVSQSNMPAPLPGPEIECLRAGLHLRSFAPHPYLAAGAKVRVKTGALAGVEGVVLRNKSSCRVVLTISLIMRSVAVEVEAGDLEFIG
jgi:transcription antitermination factor NusG